MWTYYGSKERIAHLYPYPKFSKIIEPFAGSAKYSLLHFEKDILLVDNYEPIINLWKWLQKCSEQDILKLPDIKYGESLNDYHFDCEEAKNLVGFMLGAGLSPVPREKANKIVANRPNRMKYQIKKIASNLFKIRHWKFILGSFRDIQNTEATWFIDPPYQKKGGERYANNNELLDYQKLSEWCRGRVGQVIVCENMTADWLPFHKLKNLNSFGTRRLIEAIWSNYPTDYDSEQLTFDGLKSI